MQSSLVSLRIDDEVGVVTTKRVIKGNVKVLGRLSRIVSSSQVIVAVIKGLT